MNPSTRRSRLWTGACGLAATLAWWGAYAPLPERPLPILAVGLLATLGVAALAQVGRRRWSSSAAPPAGVASALLLAPMLLVVPVARGSLEGLTGVAVVSIAIVAGAFVGFEASRFGVRGQVLLVLALIAVVVVNARLMGRRAATTGRGVEAREVTDSFPDRHVLIFGIDGGDWSVARPMIERGEMPQLGGLAERGRHGVLRSMEDAASPVVWTSLLSGHPPHLHGLDHWATSDSRNRRVPMIWDIFGAHDRSSVVVNVPGTWPAAGAAHGVVLSGFPTPSVALGGWQRQLGTIVSSRCEVGGPLPSLEARPLGDGRFDLDFPIARVPSGARFPGLSNALVDLATVRGRLALSREVLRATATVDEGVARFESPQLDGTVHVSEGEWSRPLRLSTRGGDIFFRIFVLQARDELRAYLTPPFYAADDPRSLVSSGVDRGFLTGLTAPYQVEPPGWRAHEDSRIAALLPDRFLDAERIHGEAVVKLASSLQPHLVAYVFTATDRMQHGYWREHEPSAYGPGRGPRPGLEGRDPVEEAYRLADSLLGDLLSELPEQTLVFVLSDHGARASPRRGTGGHREEGLWVAAGPGVSAAPEPLELSIYDILPTLLRCIEAPHPEDLAGSAVEEVCSSAGERERIASYTVSASRPARGGGGQRLDPSRTDQLRALGYVD